MQNQEDGAISHQEVLLMPGAGYYVVWPIEKGTL